MYGSLMVTLQKRFYSLITTLKLCFRRVKNYVKYNNQIICLFFEGKNFYIVITTYKLKNM